MFKKRIVLVDKNQAWRNLARDSLHKQGFLIADKSRLTKAEQLFGVRGDIIILGYNRISSKDQETIQRLLNRGGGNRVIVVADNVSMRTMRALFRMGVDDVVDKPYTEAGIRKIISGRSKSKNSKEARFART